MSDPIRPPRKKPGCGAFCAGGCLGGILVIALVFSIAYSRTGIYRPHIPPPDRPPNPNAYDDYLAATRMVAAQGGLNWPRQGAGPSSSSAKQLVLKHMAALTRLRKGFAKECQVPAVRSLVRRNPADNVDMRDLVRLLSAEGQVRAADGDYGGAVSCGLDSIELGLDLSRGANLSHAQVSTSLQVIGQEAIFPIIFKVPLSESATLIRRYERLIDSEVPLRKNVEEERNLALSHFVDIDTLAQTGQLYVHPSWYDSMFGGLAWHFMRDGTIRGVDDYYRAWLPELDKPTAKRRRPSGRISSNAGGFVSHTGEKTDRIEIITARNRILLLLLRLDRFRREYRRIPLQLSELKAIPRATRDPFTGDDLKYRELGDDFLLYSLGPDGKDDGGVPADESQYPLVGDVGVQRFDGGAGKKQPTSRNYGPVPFMRPPNLPAGVAPLNP